MAFFPIDSVPAALHAFVHYSEPQAQLPDDESYVKVDPNQMPGKTIWEKELSGAAEVDMPVTIPLKWNEILGENKNGAVLLTAESVDPVAGNHKRCGTQAIVQVTDLGAVWKRSKGWAQALDGPMAISVMAPLTNSAIPISIFSRSITRPAATKRRPPISLR